MTVPTSSPVRPFYIMAKPVCGVCNLSCAYCYYTSKMLDLYPGQKHFQMSLQTLEEYTRQYLQAGLAQTNFGWQGGEPLLAGLEFYRRAVEFQRQYAATARFQTPEEQSFPAPGPGGDAAPGQPPSPAGQPDQVRVIANAIQTNGLLLDEAWCRFFAANRFLVGISLDGPPEWHDHYRRDRTGAGSFGRAWAGLEMLRKHQVEFNVLVTLNRRNAPHAGDVYRYFVNRGVRWLQFIPVLEKDGSGKVKDFSCTGRQFGGFMLEVFDLWRSRHVGVVSERLIDSVLHTLVHGEAALCCNAPRCANALVLEWNGDLYACDHFVYRQWLLGNIHQAPLEELLRSPRLEAFAALKTDLPGACRGCEFLPYCQGGCPKHHLPSAEAPASDRVNHFCEGYKMFFAGALPELRRLAECLRRGQLPPAAEPDAPARPAPGAVGRNDPCPCGSGRKFKHCCGRK
jgi:uncharacterized protein